MSSQRAWENGSSSSGGSLGNHFTQLNGKIIILHTLLYLYVNFQTHTLILSEIQKALHR